MSKKYYVGAGHSNTDPGAVSGKSKEAELMTDLRNLVADQLRETGATVVTDGEGTVNKPLAQAIVLAKPCDGVRIELHLNAAGAATANGVECLSLEKHKQKAQDIAHAIATTLGLKLRGGNKGWKPDNEGQHSRLAFCREADGIIVECFFISNPDELKKYQEHKIEAAKAIAGAILKP